MSKTIEVLLDKLPEPPAAALDTKAEAGAKIESHMIPLDSPPKIIEFTVIRKLKNNYPEYGWEKTVYSLSEDKNPESKTSLCKTYYIEAVTDKTPAKDSGEKFSAISRKKAFSEFNEHLSKPDEISTIVITDKNQNKKQFKGTDLPMGLELLTDITNPGISGELHTKEGKADPNTSYTATNLRKIIEGISDKGTGGFERNN